MRIFPRFDWKKHMTQIVVGIADRESDKVSSEIIERALTMELSSRVERICQIMWSESYRFLLGIYNSKIIPGRGFKSFMH